MIPDRARCLELMAEEGMPPHIRAHSEQVAKVALAIGKALQSAGETVDLALIEAGALLHDIRKIHSINDGGNHARQGADFVTSIGFTELAPLVLRHVNLGEWDPKGRVDEAEIINYADKRVRHEEIVSLEERFVDLLERYGVCEGSRTRILRLREEMEMLEAKIFANLPFNPEAIADR
ncbi:HDIG domain-containing protein [bacterium]|nr:MAG: HDIG domain-containing protein [bacterium]